MKIQMRFHKAAWPALACVLLVCAGCANTSRAPHGHRGMASAVHHHASFPNLVLAGPVIGDPAASGWEVSRSDHRMGHDDRTPHAHIEIFEQYSRDRISTFSGRVHDSSTTQTRTYIRRRYE